MSYLRLTPRMVRQSREALTLAGLPEYDPDEYEEWKGNTRAIFNGYDGLPHTDEERIAAAIQYLRVRFCQDSWCAIASNGWARFLRFYPDFRAYVRSQYAHYAHEFDATIHAGIAAQYGPVLLSEEDYRAREAEYLAVHTSLLSSAAKDRATLEISDEYARRLLDTNRQGEGQS